MIPARIPSALGQRGLHLAVVFAALLCTLATVFALTFPSLSGRVVDQANIIQATTLTSIEQKLADLERKSGIQLVVATVTSLEGQGIEPYAKELFRSWKLGEKTKNNAVLLLVAPNERFVRIVVGHRLVGTLTDARAKEISDAMTPRFRAGDFSGGITRGVDDIITVLSTHNQTFNPVGWLFSEEAMDTWFALVILFVLALPIISILALVTTLKLRGGVRQLQMRVAALEASRPPTPTVAVRPSPIAEPTAKEPSPAMETLPAEPAAPIAPPAAPPGPVKPPPAVAAPTLEERFGTQWVVWIGGLALALGGIFLVRYTVEQGLLGPGVRIVLAAIFAGLLIAAGEWARRNEIASGITAIPTRHIPSILTAAGTVAAYATVYAAFALYGFSVAGGCLRLARHRGTGHIGGGAAARASTCRSRRCRRFRHTSARAVRGPKLLGALHLSCHRYRRCLRAGAHAVVALACDHSRPARRDSGHFQASHTRMSTH